MKPDLLARATSTLRDATADCGDVEAIPPARSEAIAGIAEALRRRRIAQRRRRFGFIAAAAVVALAAGFFAQRKPEQAAVPPPVERARVGVSETGLVEVRDGRESALAPGDRVADGAELRTPAKGEANLDFEGGSHLAVGASSRVRLLEQAQHKRFALDEGRLHAKVAKLAPHERFVVTTSDSEIEVRGTEFEVSLVTPDPSCADATPTRVDVREGVVVVRHGGVEHRVEAGEHWPACATAAPPPSTSVAPPPWRSAPRTVAAPAPPPPAEPAAIASSRLAEQNDLFQEALRRKRSGDAKGALEALDRLSAQYGDGPLAESAEVERFRVLASIDRARGAAAAREYLRKRPRGFARAEAESLAGP